MRCGPRVEWRWSKRCVLPHPFTFAPPSTVCAQAAGGGSARPSSGSEPTPGDLRKAAEKGNLEEVTRLADRGADLQDADGHGETALHWAAGHGHQLVAEFLLQRGAHPHAANKSGNCPLHLAAANGHTDFCRLLLDFKADINSRSEHGETPLKWAIAGGYTATAKALRAEGGVEMVEVA